MRILFLISLLASLSLLTFAQDSSNVDKLGMYKQLLERGEINKIEFNQLKAEHLRLKFGIADIETYRTPPTKARGQIIAGSVLVVAGAGFIAGGFIKHNQFITQGPPDEYEHRKKVNKRSSFSFMGAGAAVGLTGIILTSIGVAKKKRHKKDKNSIAYDLGYTGDGIVAKVIIPIH